MARTERGLRPFMRADERLIEYDIAQSIDVVEMGTRTRGSLPSNTAVVISSHALYLHGVSAPSGRESIRIPYESVLTVFGMASLFNVVTPRFAYEIAIARRPLGDLGESIAQGMSAVVRWQGLVEEDGRPIEVTLRPTREAGESEWLFMFGALAGRTIAVGNPVRRPLENDIDVDGYINTTRLYEMVAAAAPNTGVPLPEKLCRRFPEPLLFAGDCRLAAHGRTPTAEAIQPSDAPNPRTTQPARPSVHTPTAPHHESSSEPPPSAPPNWYPDPYGRYQYRYWSGSTWTDDVANGGTPSRDEPG